MSTVTCRDNHVCFFFAQYLVAHTSASIGALVLCLIVSYAFWLRSNCTWVYVNARQVPIGLQQVFGFVDCRLGGKKKKKKGAVKALIFFQRISSPNTG